MLGHGNRAGGKTDALLMIFARQVGKGWGAAWSGIIFRRTYKQLEDIIARSIRWFPRIFPGAYFNVAASRWEFPAGERLLLRYMWDRKDYEHYHGHEYPFIGWEELSNWPTNECYELMKSCSRAAMPGMPRYIRGTTNSYGVGHAWLKAYFIDAAQGCVPVGTPGLQRTHVYMDVEDNAPFLQADPDYITRLDAITDENLRKAWRYGSWDIVAGAYFADVWRPAIHVLEPFPIPGRWKLDRTHDWGESKPFCTLWYAESNGEEVEIAPSVKRSWPKGTLFVIAEDYGWNGKPNEGIRITATAIAQRVKATEERMKVWGRVQPGPADLPAMRSGQSLEQDMAQVGIRWLPPDKGPGSRVTGWARIYEYLENATKSPQERPGLFIFTTCTNLIRTLPALPRDEKDPDDIDSESEDHAGDALRMKLLNVGNAMTISRMRT